MIGTEVFTPPGSPFEVERLLLSWRGNRDHQLVNHSLSPDCGTTVSTESGSGGGAAGSTLMASSFGPGIYGLAPEDNPPSSYELPITFAVYWDLTRTPSP